MAEQIISPGVFTRENDLSFLPQGIGAIGAAIIGPTEKGPAFVPTVVRSFAEFERRFGPLKSDTFVPQTVREYLKNAGSVTVCRVLGGGGYTYADGTNEIVALAISGSEGNVLLGAIFPSKAGSKPDLSTSTFQGQGEVSMSQQFSLVLNGDNVSSTQFSGSINPANKDYIFKQLGYTPDNSKTASTLYAGTPGYTYLNFKNLTTDIQGATTKEISTLTLNTITTGALHEATASILLTSGDDNAFQIVFSGSIGFKAPDAAASTGSLLIVNMSGSDTTGTNGHTHTALSGSVLGALLDDLTIPGIIVSSSIVDINTSLITFTNVEASDVLDITFVQKEKADNNALIAAATGSVAVITKGTDVTGYGGLNVSRPILFLTQSSDLVFSGEIGQNEGYGYASTPFITSQFVGGAHPNKTTKELFKLHTLDHGKHLCHNYKISIANLKEASDIDGVEQYSSFSVIVRRMSDKDKSPVILEQFNGCTLDPDSPTFISRVIGDRYPQYNDTLGKVELLGNYPNISNYLRVEVSSAVESRATSPKLSPKGFKAVKDTINVAAFSDTVVFPSASYEGKQLVGTNYSAKAYLGFKFIDKDSDNEAFLNPLPDNSAANISGDFNIEDFEGHPSSSLWSGSLSASIDTTGVTGPTSNQLKFTIPFQGGDDGTAPYTIPAIGNETTNGTFVTGYTTGTNLYGFDLSSTSKAGYKAYKKAIDILANQDEYDINMLAMPGVIHSLHPLVTNAGIDMCEERGDAFFVMDLTRVDSSVNTAVSHVDGIDTNYAAVYYPWVKVLDSAKNKPVLVPPSVIVPGAIAASDRIAAEWFAPAGLNRGVLGNVIEAKMRLNQSERDTLYDAKINPIATFPQTGVCIWGQKTLQERSTALDRINVRRLMIALKKFIASSSRYLVFEQNTQATRNRFLNIVNPYLESVQQRQGLYAFRVQMDEANNTPDVIDRNQLVGAIFLQPAKTAEFIVLDFNVLPTGATFDGAGGAGGGGGY